MYRDKVYREARRSMSNAENVKIFFRGVNDTESVKKRYKALLKIYHPDNMNGDNDLVLAINEEYERLLRFYLGTQHKSDNNSYYCQVCACFYCCYVNCVV